jgi:hypothetical protein
MDAPISGYLSSNKVGLNEGTNFVTINPYKIPRNAIKIIQGFPGRYLARYIKSAKNIKKGKNSTNEVDPKFLIVSKIFS